MLDGGELAGAASGRNGGFLSSFLTHGIDNGLARFPDEMPALERLGLENFADTRADLERLGIECDFHAAGDLDVAVEPHELALLDEYAEALARFGHDAEVLDRDAIRAQIDSPLFLGGVWRRSGSAVVDPAKLCWGLARAAEELGVRIHEHTRVGGIERHGAGVALVTEPGAVRARRALLATSAFPGLLRRTRQRVVPVWDYVLVTEPLSAEQRAAIGWAGGQGLGDMANRFHYSRPTADGRILWGGFDAIYYYASGIGPERQSRERDLRRPRRPLLRRLPAARGDPLQPPVGRRDRHLLAASSPSTGPRSADGSPTRSAIPVSASAPAASAPR